MDTKVTSKFPGNPPALMHTIGAERYLRLSWCIKHQMESKTCPCGLQLRRESLYHWHMISLYLDIWNENHGRKPKP